MLSAIERSLVPCGIYLTTHPGTGSSRNALNHPAKLVDTAAGGYWSAVGPELYFLAQQQVTEASLIHLESAEMVCMCVCSFQSRKKKN